MSSQKRLRRFWKKRGGLLFITGGMLALTLFVGIKTIRHRIPEDIKRASLILEAMEKATCAGDVWGLDIYLERKNQEIQSRSFLKERCLIAGLFAETIIKTAAWERPLDDIRHTFYVLREEKLRKLSEATIFLIRAKDLWREIWIRDEPLSPTESLKLRDFREEEKALLPAEMAKRYQEALWKTEDEGLKIRLLAREAYLDQALSLPRFKRRLQELKRYEREGKLPFSIVLSTQEMARGDLLRAEILGSTKRGFAMAEAQTLLSDYQKALEALSAGNTENFIDQAEALAARHEKREAAPLLLYQAWGVAFYDLQDHPRAEAILKKLKKEYPVSDWAYPERAPKHLSAVTKLKKQGPRSLGEALLPMNFFRRPAQESMESFFEKMRKICDELEPGATKEIVLDEAVAQEHVPEYFSSSAQQKLRGYQVNFCEQGVRAFWGTKIGFMDVVFLGRGSLEAKNQNNPESMELKLRELRFQGIPIPRAFLRQIEGDFRMRLRKEALPLDLIESKYWKGGAKFVFRKRIPPGGEALGSDPLPLTEMEIPEHV